MRSWGVRRAALLLLLLAACKRPRGVPDAPVTCAESADCKTGWVCLAGRCADPSAAAVYEHPQNAVTPEKVKNEVDQTLEREHARTLEDPVH